MSVSHGDGYSQAKACALVWSQEPVPRAVCPSSPALELGVMVSLITVVVITLCCVRLIIVLSKRRVSQSLQCIWRKIRRLITGEKKFDQDRRLLEAELGRNLINVALTYKNLGKTFQEAGRYDESLGFYLKALKLEKNGFERDDHPQMGSTYHNIGVILCRKGEYREAMKQLKNAIKAQGLDHPESGETYHAMGRVLCDEFKHEEAMKQFEKALAIKLRVHGLKHPSTGETFLLVGQVLVVKRKYKKAMEQSIKGLVTILKAHGPKHPETAKPYYSLMGAVLSEQRRFDEAFENLQDAIAILLNVGGRAQFCEVGRIFMAMGFLCKHQGKYDEAKKQWQKALGFYEKEYGPNDRRTIAAERALLTLEWPDLGAILALSGY